MILLVFNNNNWLWKNFEQIENWYEIFSSRISLISLCSEEKFSWNIHKHTDNANLSIKSQIFIFIFEEDFLTFDPSILINSVCLSDEENASVSSKWYVYLRNCRKLSMFTLFSAITIVTRWCIRKQKDVKTIAVSDRNRALRAANIVWPAVTD